MYDRPTTLEDHRSTKKPEAEKLEDYLAAFVILKGKSHEEKQRSQIVVQNRAGCGGVGR